MFSRFTPHRHVAPLPTAFLTIVTCLLLLVPILDATAQVIRSNPTPTPTPEFNPGLVAQPTETPTEISERVSPTEAPAPADNVPASGTITINTGACDDVTFDPVTASGLDTFIEACQSPDGEFEFTVSDGVGFSATTWTTLGTVTFEVPTATIAMVESIPAGWGDPAVFCWSNLLPTPSDTPFIGNGPTWDVQPGEAVECWWFNISQPPTEPHTIRVTAYACPPEADLGTDYWTLAVACLDYPMEGVAFDLVTDAETLDGTTGANGTIEWTEVDLGANGVIQIDEAAPGGYGEPTVWCVSFPAEAGDPEDFDNFAVEATDGLISVQPERTSPFIFECRYFHQAIGSDSGDLIDPSSVEDGDGNTILLNKFRCPLGAPYEDFGSDIFDYCTDPHAGMEFSLYHDDLNDNQSTDVNGAINWTGLPDGEFTIVEQTVSNYQDVIVYCEWTGIPADVVVQAGRFQVPAPEAQFVLDFPTTGMTIECGAFNLPRYESRILVNKRMCPSGVDLALTNVNTINDMIVACPVQGNGIEFTLDNAYGTSTQAIENGATFWDGVPHGPFTLTEDVPAGYVTPVWYCDSVAFNEDGDLVGNHAWELVLAPGGVLSASIDAEFGEIFACWVFNVPDPDIGSVTVVKWLCPVGFSVETDNHLTDCLELWDGVTFTLNDLEATTGEAGPGLAAFLNLEPGEYDLTETLPGGIAEMFFNNCDLNGAQQPMSITLTDPPVLNLTIGAGEHWVCPAYNVQEMVEENTIIIDKWQCPEGAAVWQSHHWLSTNCTDPHDGVEFEITTDFGSVTMQTVGGTLQLGPIGPMFDVAIQEDIPDGFGDPAVYCAVDDGAHFQIGAPGGYWEHEFANDDVAETLSCEVYNIPEEENRIELHKWQCPEGTGTGESLDWYLGTCTDAHDGVDFSVASDIGIAVMETSGGQVQFDGLPAGTAGIQEFIPDGFGAPVVFCAPEDSIWMEFDAPTGHWEYDFLDDGTAEILTCHVLNIPGEPGSVTIEKWTCPPLYNLYALGANPDTDCTKATNGVQFQFGLAAEGSLAELQTTGDILDGAVVFDGLEPDTYKAVELIPDGITSVFVLRCTGHIMGVLQPYPLVTGNVLEIEVDAGEHLTCVWLNVPEPEAGSITLFKYTCATETFISEVDCQIEEDGVTFDLLVYNEGTATWDLVDTQETDGFGQIHWTDLNSGEYQVAEHGAEWCHLAIEPEEDSPGVARVVVGTTFEFHVYNCDGTPGEPGDTPTKYPNTGFPPAAMSPSHRD